MIRPTHAQVGVIKKANIS